MFVVLFFFFLPPERTVAALRYSTTGGLHGLQGVMVINTPPPPSLPHP